MIKGHVFLLTFLFLAYGGVGQHLEKVIPLSAAFTLRDAQFSVFNDVTVVPDFATQGESLYDTPENVLRAELSANSLAWMDEIYLPGLNDATADDIAEKITNLKFLSCKLRHKLSFISPAGERSCFLQGTMQYNNSPFFGICILYKYVNGRWYRASMEELRDLGMVVWITKSAPLHSLLQGSTTGSVHIDEVISKTYTPFGFDPSIFLELMEHWKETNDDKLNIFLDQ